MNILHIANFSWFSAPRKRADDLARYYACDHKISNGLIRNQHCVWNFSYRDAARYLSPLARNKKLGEKAMNAAVIRTARVFAPGLILLGHCELISAHTLTVLRDALPGVKIAQWWVDPFHPHSLPHLRAKQPYLDAFFATTAPSYYAPLIAAAPTAAVFYLPNPVDNSIEKHRAFENPQCRYDVFFAGSSLSERNHTLQQLSQIQSIRLGLFGFGGRSVLSGAKFMQIIGDSKIGLNLSFATDIPMYSSDRIAQLTGNGCLALSPNTPQMERLFGDNEIAYYAGDDELREQINRLLQDDITRIRIAKAGWKRAHTCYNERRVAKFIVEAATGEEFSESYQWL